MRSTGRFTCNGGRAVRRRRRRVSRATEDRCRTPDGALLSDRVPLLDRARERLADLDAGQLRRRLVELEGPTGPTVIVGGRELICLASNDYLGLARDPSIAAAVADGARRWGSGAGASRLVTGHLRVHREAEEALARWVGLPAALVFSSGHAANLGTLQTLLEDGDLVLSDALDHASLIDGCRLSHARVQVFRHRDLGHLEALLRAHRASARTTLIVTDAVFSMDGVAADLPGLRALADRYDAALVVDEAHSLGVVGPEGRGLCAATGVSPDVLVGTLGKSLGLAGAFVAAAPEIVELLVNRARSFVFSTALAPPIAAAVPVAVERARNGDQLRTAVRERAEQLRAGLRRADWPVASGQGPILPVILGAADAVLAAATALEARGVLVRPIRPPTVAPGTARLRVTITAAHDEALVARAIAAFAEAR